MADKKNSYNLVIAAMVKRQIQSQFIDDVVAELDKGANNTISRTGMFDRDTGIVESE